MRLIDADAFVEAVKKDLRKYPEEDLIYPVMEWFLDNIKSRPTIEQPTWVSCEERLPTDEKQVIAYYGFDHGDGLGDMRFIQTLAYFCFDKEPHWQYAGLDGLTVTHWMPLPMPPKEDE